MSRPTILIVDDAADHRDILGRLLRSTGYEVVEAAPGPDALSHAVHTTPDLVLVGLTLPGQAAWETARALRLALAHTPILGTTVFSTLLSRHHMIALGFADCLDKPFDLDALLTCVRQFLPSA